MRTPNLSDTRLSDERLAELFANQMGWDDFRRHNCGKNVFSLLLEASHACNQNTIVLDISAGQCRYRPFFQHSQYLAIDSAVGDANWDFSKLDFIGDVFQLPIASDSIDVCSNFTSLEHYPEPNQAFAEISRVLKPGGKLFLYVPCCIPEHQIPYDFFRYTRYALARFCENNHLNIGFLKASNSIFETTISMVEQAIDCLAKSTLRDHVSKIKDSLAEIFRELEKTQGTFVDYPNTSPVPQFPSAYCLCAIKPGSAPASLLEPTREQLLKRVAACPICKGSLQWDSKVLSCDRCKLAFGFKKGIPDLMPQSGRIPGKVGIDEDRSSNEISSETNPFDLPHAEIIDVIPDMSGVHLVIRCKQCGKEFEKYQIMIADAALGRHECPDCHSSCVVWPDEFIEAIERFLPKLDFAEAVNLTDEASNITETWYEHPALQDILTYRGINMGEPPERTLVSFVILGLLDASKRK